MRCEIEYTRTKSAVVNTKQRTSYVVPIRLLGSLQISKTYKSVLDYSNSNISTFLQFTVFTEWLACVIHTLARAYFTCQHLN